MLIRRLCCAAPLVLLLGCAGVQAHVAPQGTATKRAAALAVRDAPVLMTTALVVAPAVLEPVQPRQAPVVVASVVSASSDEAPESNTLALLSALGAVFLLVARSLVQQ